MGIPCEEASRDSDYESKIRLINDYLQRSCKFSIHVGNTYVPSIESAPYCTLIYNFALILLKKLKQKTIANHSAEHLACLITMTSFNFLDDTYVLPEDVAQYMCNCMSGDIYLRQCRCIYTCQSQKFKSRKMISIHLKLLDDWNWDLFKLYKEHEVAIYFYMKLLPGSKYKYPLPEQHALV